VEGVVSILWHGQLERDREAMLAGAVLVCWL
jgi:hypothetical protein